MHSLLVACPVGAAVALYRTCACARSLCSVPTGPTGGLPTGGLPPAGSSLPCRPTALACALATVLACVLACVLASWCRLAAASGVSWPVCPGHRPGLCALPAVPCHRLLGEASTREHGVRTLSLWLATAWRHLTRGLAGGASPVPPRRCVHMHHLTRHLGQRWTSGRS
jgi:hypothetical protein